MGGGTCIMNYDLQYSRSGKEEFLEGTYLGKTEVKDGPIHTSGVNAVPVKSFFERWRPLIFISSRHCGPLQKIGTKQKCSSTCSENGTKQKCSSPVVKEKPVTPPPVTRKTTIPKSNPPAGKKQNSATAENKNKVKEQPTKVNPDSLRKNTPEISRIPDQTP
jgi:hypothetical protein